MNKKQIIQIAVITLAFAGAGFVLYQGGVLGGGGSGSSTPTEKKVAPPAAAILPYGDSLDLSQVINTSRFNYKQPTFEKLNPLQDVGVPVDRLIVPTQPK